MVLGIDDVAVRRKAAAGVIAPASMAARICPRCPICLNRAFSADLEAADNWPCSASSAARAAGIPWFMAFLVASRDASGAVRPLSSQR